MIILEELNQHKYLTTPEIDKNLAVLLDRLNRLRMVYSRPMVITSGLRSNEQQKSLIDRGMSTATQSRHLIGAAADVLDIDGALYDWCKANTKILEDIGLWCEERQGGWQHFQIFPPKSAHRWFWP